MNRIPRLLFIVTFIILGFVVPVKADTVTLGGSSDGSRYPFGMDPSSASSSFPDYAGGGVYQQVYAASAFSGLITITQIAFASSGAFTSGPGMATFNFNIGLSTTSAGPGSLSSTFLANRGSDFTQVFSGPLNVAITDKDQFDLVIDVVPFTYDPSVGRLLLEVSLNSPTQFTGGPALFFVAGFDPNTSRVANPLGGPTATVIDGFGVRTRFKTAEVPEPTSLLLLGTGVVGVFGGLRKRLKR